MVKALLIKTLVASELISTYTEKVLKISMVLRAIGRYTEALQTLRALMVRYRRSFFSHLKWQTKEQYGRGVGVSSSRSLFSMYSSTGSIVNLLINNWSIYFTSHSMQNSYY